MSQRTDEGHIWPEQRSAWKSPWLRGWVGLLFLVVFVNGLMAYFAFNTSTGLVVKDYYERGQSFTERTRIKKQALKNLGWDMGLEHGALTVGRAGDFTFTLKAADTRKLPDSVSLKAYRPFRPDMDFTVPMEMVGNGVYKARASFPLPGNWDLIAVVKSGEVEADLARRVYVEEPEG